MKYKVGDRVKIKSWEQMALEYGGTYRYDEEQIQICINTPDYCFLSEMKIYCGDIMEIVCVRTNNTYYMKGSDHVWTDEMIERIVANLLPDDATYNDLEPDMVLTYKDGNRFFTTMVNEEKCLIGENCVVSHFPKRAIKLMDDQVKKVEKVTEIGRMRSVFCPKNSYVVWEENKEMTVAEVEEALGKILKVSVHIKINS